MRLPFFPYYNFMRTLIYSGFSGESIIENLRLHNLNPPDKLEMDEFIKKCGSFPEGADMIAQNKIRYEQELEPLLHKEVMDTFRNKIEVEDFIYYHMRFKLDNKKVRARKKKSAMRRLIRSLESTSMKTFLETSLMVRMPLDVIHTLWNRGAESSSYKISYENMGKYYYFFWDVSANHMMNHQWSRKDITVYLLRDPYNAYYDQHRFLLDKTDTEARYFTGFMTNEDRLKLNRVLQGILTRKMIVSLQSKGNYIPQWAAMVWNNINDEQREYDMNENGPQKHIDELRRIFQRALGIHRDDEYINSHKGEVLEELPNVQDEQVDILSRRS